MTWGQGSSRQMLGVLPKYLPLTRAPAFLTNPKSNRSPEGHTARWQEARAASVARLASSNLPTSLVPRTSPSPPGDPTRLSTCFRFLLCTSPVSNRPSISAAKPQEQSQWHPRWPGLGIAKASMERGMLFWRQAMEDAGRKKLNLQWKNGWPKPSRFKADWEEPFRQGSQQQ